MKDAADLERCGWLYHPLDYWERMFVFIAECSNEERALLYKKMKGHTIF